MFKAFYFLLYYLAQDPMIQRSSRKVQEGLNQRKGLFHLFHLDVHFTKSEPSRRIHCVVSGPICREGVFVHSVANDDGKSPSPFMKFDLRYTSMYTVPELYFSELIEDKPSPFDSITGYHWNSTIQPTN